MAAATNLPEVDWRKDYRTATTSTAIGQIVEVYFRLNNRRALEELRMHRQRLAADIKLRTADLYDFSLPIGQIDEEIAVIEVGLERLIYERSSGHAPD
jgi:hypothetical protein